MKYLKIIVVVLFFVILKIDAQTYNLQQLLAENKLEIFSGSGLVKSEENKEAVRFDVFEQVAYIKGVEFANGEIEIDLKGKDVQQNSFLGVAFHGIDGTTYDAVYFRPFNFQTTDSVRHIHAVQYISSPDFPWQKLRKEQNAKYEKAINPAPDPNAWFHARIVVNNGSVKVFVNNAQTPSLEVNTLNSRTKGKVGIWLNGSFASFANLIIKKYE
jgi:Domain of Unknown Function (DUF1080)